MGAEAILAQDSDITLRELSVKVFNDSKRLEKVLPQSLTIIRHSNPVLTDKIILDNLKNWTIERIAKIDLAILRLAIFVSVLRAYS